MTIRSNIFINCPFDNQYLSTLLKPMLYYVASTISFIGLTKKIRSEARVKAV